MESDLTAWLSENLTSEDLILTPEYSMSKEEQKKTQKQIDEEADRMLADAPTDGTDYDKALYVLKN